MSHAQDDRLRYLAQHLFTHGAGVCLSGGSGAGKSNSQEAILRAVITHQPGTTVLFIDPHGTSARRLHRWCLSRGASIADRVLYWQPSDTDHIVGFNCLAVPDEEPGSVRWRGRIAVTVEDVTKILLSAWGETNMNSKPILAKNVYRILSTLAHAGLTLADCRLFLDVQSPLYQSLLRFVPDLTARAEMEELSELRPADRMAQLESGKNRLLGLVQNPIIEAILGSPRSFDMAALYRDRTIFIANLEQGNVLRMEDQKILANLLLTSFISTVMNARERHFSVVAVDELPIFESSADLLTSVFLPQIRKFLCRGIFAFQSVSSFADQDKSRFLHALLSQCQTQFHMRHIGRDCEFFGKHLAIADFCPTKEKHTQTVPMQFQDGHEIVVLQDRNLVTTESTTTGTGASSGTANTLTESSGQSTSVGHKYDPMDKLRSVVERVRTDTSGSQTGRSTAAGKTEQTSSSLAHGTSKAQGVTWKSQLVPLIRLEDIVTSVQFLSKEDQDAGWATRLARLSTGSAIMYSAGSAPTEVRFPLVPDAYARSPEFAAEMEREYLARLAQRPEVATLEAITERRAQLLDALLVEINRLDADHERFFGQPPKLQGEVLDRKNDDDSPLAI